MKDENRYPHTGNWRGLKKKLEEVGMRRSKGLRALGVLGTKLRVDTQILFEAGYVDFAPTYLSTFYTIITTNIKF
jgi:hypothetical protein